MTSEIVDTKLEAFKLITDPTRLFSLIFSKYGEIQEDFYIEISNQLIYNELTHLNICFKEYNTFYDATENVRRFYNKQESITKISKLNEFYKNYQLFFCKPFLLDITISNLLKNCQDTKAEIFYKNNYGDSSTNKEENDQSKIIHNSSSLSSLDNITYNKTIFDKKYKNIIENCDKSTNSLILTLDSYLNSKNEDSGLSKGNLISVNSSSSNNEKDKSFVDSLNNLITFYKKKASEKQKNSEEDKNIKNYNLNNLCKDMNVKIKNKILEKKGILDKPNEENNKNQNLTAKPKLPNIIKAPILKINSREKKDSFNEKKYEKAKIKTIKENNSKNEKNLLLSPNKKKFNFTNLTSRISEFKKFRPINIKNTKRNKSYNLNNNKNTEQIVPYNKSPNPNNNISFPHNNQKIELKIKSINDNSNKNIKLIKSNNSQISRYNQFLKRNNKPKKNQKNITHELLNKRSKIKNLSNKNIIFNQYKKLVNSPSQNHKIEINNNNSNFKSNFNLFKSGNLSPSRLNPINKHNNNKRSLNILQTYNKFINQTKTIEQHKKFIISSNSINNNIHISSLSPKSLSTNLKLNKSKSNSQNSINIINKINLPNNNHKRRMRNSNYNNNYNINFNNLFFYGPNTPVNFDTIKNNIINNQNQNLNINKINANFYILSFNNLNNSNQLNSRNKIKVNNMNNNSLHKIKFKTNNNSIHPKNLRKCESQKRYTNYKKRGLNLNEKKIPFTINKIIFEK